MRSFDRTQLVFLRRQKSVRINLIDTCLRRYDGVLSWDVDQTIERKKIAYTNAPSSSHFST